MMTTNLFVIASVQYCTWNNCEPR